MSVQRRYTSADLDLLPAIGGVRYEIIDGELHVSKQPTWRHQRACNRVSTALTNWSDATGLGEATPAPGLIFAEDDDVAPDVVWISKERFEGALDDAEHLRKAPELVVEVLSPGSRNERRDRETKLALYARHDVLEYWIVDCRLRTVYVFRRDGDELMLAATLMDDDMLTSPILPGFSCAVRRLW
jgi:Uma2 family endonuclease